MYYSLSSVAGDLIRDLKFRIAHPNFPALDPLDPHLQSLFYLISGQISIFGLKI